MTATVPYVCERCIQEGSYNGSLRHKDTDPIPQCRHHGKVPVDMTPVKEKR